jgi:hypothetical protein
MYVDMPAQLCSWFMPHLIYTFQPSQVARATGEYAYTFDDQNQVRYTVSGGATYKHMVWNYGQDTLVVKGYHFGIHTTTACYYIDRKAVDHDHEAILLSPIRRWFGVWAWIAALLSGEQLSRLRPKQEEFLRLKVQKKDGVYASTGRVGSYISATIPIESDEALSIVARRSKLDLTLPQAMAYVEGDRVSGTILMDYHRFLADSQTGEKTPYVFPIELSIHRYQFKPVTFDPEAKPALMAFMHPIVRGAYSPDVTEENEKRCIEGRVVEPKNDTPVIPFVSKIIDEFLEFLIPEKRILDPVDEEEVYNRQPRPTQRRTLEAGQYSEPERIVKMFIKKEAYPGVKDPRPISQINGTDKANYSKYIYAFVDEIIKPCHWYAFGKSPVDVAHRVAAILENAFMAVNTDFSTFDGTVSPVLRELETRAMLRAFRTIYHEEILDLMNSQHHILAFAMYTAYAIEWARLSGSPETAGFNSLGNAFVAYLNLRRTRVNGAFISPIEAWGRLGIYGGDDGITPDVDPKTYEESATMVGLRLAAEPIKRGTMGIKFLARIYGPNVWFGDVNSCCDLRRQLSKFHVTVHLPPHVTPEHKLMEKARSFFLTDANTPIIGPLVRRVLILSEIEDLTNPIVPEIARWGSDIPLDVQYPNALDDWMVAYMLETFPSFRMDWWMGWISTCRTLNDLLYPPVIEDMEDHGKPKADVVVDEDIVLADIKGKQEEVETPPQDDPGQAEGTPPNEGAVSGPSGLHEKSREAKPPVGKEEKPKLFVKRKNKPKPSNNKEGKRKPEKHEGTPVQGKKPPRKRRGKGKK